MRRRRWVAVVAVLIIAVLSVSFLALKVGSRHPAVKRAVLSRILPDVGAQLSIGELEIGLASLTLGDVSVEMGPRGSVHLPTATVSLSYRKLLQNGLEPRRALSTVIVSDPTVHLRYGISKSETPDAVGLLDLGPYLPDYLGISDAVIVLEDARTGRSVKLSSLDMLIERGEEAVATGSASASALGGESNLSVDFEWETRNGVLTAEAELAGAELSPRLPLPADVPLELIGGTVDARSSAAIRADADPQWSVTFALRRGEIGLPEELGTVSGVAADGTFGVGDLRATVSSGEWRGAAVSGIIDVDVSRRTYDRVELSFRNLDTAGLADLAGDLPTSLAGTLSIDADVRGPWDDAAADLAARSAVLTVGGARLEDFVADAAYSRGRVDVSDASFRIFGGSASLSGALEIPGDEEGMRVEASGDARDLDAGLVGEFLDAGRFEGELSITDLELLRSRDRLEVESLLSWRSLRVGPLVLGSGAGGFIVRDDALSGSLSAADGSAALSGEVRSLSGEPKLDLELALEGARLDSLAPGAARALAGMSVAGALSAAGPADGFSLGGTLAAQGDHASANVAITGIAGLGADGGSVTLEMRSSDAVVRGVETPFAATVTADTSRVALSPLTVGGVGEVALELGTAAPGALSGSVVISEADVSDVVTLLSGVRLPASMTGLAFASVSLGGTLDSPAVSGQVQIGNGSALGVDDLTAVLSASLADGVLDVREMTMSERGRRFVEVGGSADLDGYLALSVRGDGVPGPLLGGDDETLFDVGFGVGGTWSSPALDGVVEGEDGSFLGVPFDAFLARVTGADGVVRVDPLSLEKRGSYRARAAGSVPLSAFSSASEGEDGTINIDVDGDVLAFLAEVAPFMESATGEGSMHAVLAGRRGDVTVASARLAASGGVVRPNGVFDRIDDASAAVVIADGVVTEGEVGGRVRGRSITLASLRRRPAELPGVEPLAIAGVDVGVLALTTDPEGVRASVPGLMAEEEVGRVAARGKAGAPALIIGGPTERPRLWGELVFSDASFTYPLIDPGGSGNFLSASEWSLRMIAGRNLWYTRPDANLNIVRDGWLDFEGVPDDGTLCVSGRVEAKRGNITYANADFDVREAFIDFPLFCEPPRFYAFAETRVEDGTTISLTMDSYEDAFTSTVPGATFDESELRLASDSPDDVGREEILAKLQYGVSYALLETEEQESLERRRALEVVGSQLSGRIVRPLLTPFEGRLKRALNLDLVRFDIDFVEHFLAQLDLWQAQEGAASYQPFLSDTRVTLGKYISRDWLLSYVGHAETYEEDLGDERLGLRQELGVEYEVSRNTSLSMRVVYDPDISGWDRRISIENRFRF